MFENSYRFLKGVAIFCFVANVIVSFAVAVTLFGSKATVGAGVAVIILGPVAAYVITSLLYGFADLVGQSREQTELLRKMINSDPRPAAPVKNKVPARPTAPSPAPAKASVPNAPVVPEISPGGMYICPACRTVQNPDRSVCYNCGAKFIKDESGEEQVRNVL